MINFIDTISLTLIHLSSYDARAKIPNKDLIISLILNFSKDSRKTPLASIRRTLIAEYQLPLTRSTFWCRMATKSLRKNIVKVCIQLMKTLTGNLINSTLIKSIGVKKIFILDSTSISLPKKAKDAFPGPRNNVAPASIKWHALFDLTHFSIPWSETSPATSSDNNFFPIIKDMAGSLVIFDLGYNNYFRFRQLNNFGIFFLTRLKSNAQLQIKKSCIWDSQKTHW